MTEPAYASLPPLGALSLRLLYAELARMQTRCARPVLFGDEVRWSGATRGERRSGRERRVKVAV